MTIVERDTVHGLVRFHPAHVKLFTVTDVRGEYRLENLNLGEYFVVAIPRNRSAVSDGRLTRTGHAITYHPSAPRAVDAMLSGETGCAPWIHFAPTQSVER